jgi:hypothetical protein
MFTLRLGALGLALTAAISCDQRVPTGTIGGGGGGGNQTGVDITPPTVTISVPVNGDFLNLGDSVFAQVTIRDNQNLQSVALTGVTHRGDPDLGNNTIVQRFLPNGAPNGGATFRTGLRDTTIMRWLRSVTPVDTTQDNVVFTAIVTDAAGLADTASVTARLVSGPKVVFISPPYRDSVEAGVLMNVQMRITSDQGVSSVRLRARSSIAGPCAGGPAWQTPIVFDTTASYAGSPQQVDFFGSVLVPANAPARGCILLTPSATDANGIPGSSQGHIVFVRSSASPPPIVKQEVPPRAEVIDTVIITATGSGIRSLGFVVDTVGGEVRRDSVVFAPPYSSPQRVSLSLNLNPALQGRKVAVRSFAYDQDGVQAWSVPMTASTPQINAGAAHVDSALVVHGRTYTLPRKGIAGDIAVDTTRGHVFVSNTKFNRLEVWQGLNQQFDPFGVAVGSEPWGMAIGNDPNVLLVANSGGTNISRVDINQTDPRQIREILGSRILTRNTYLFVVQEERDANTGKVRLSLMGPFSYSDRPQYVQQSAGGRIYYSTKPTQTAPAGTIRWLDPNLAVPDPRQIWQYGTATGSVNTYVIFNVDSAEVIQLPATDVRPDTLVLWDHPYGTASTLALEGRGPTTVQAAAALGASSDVEVVAGLDHNSLALTDTTFVATSGDRIWVAFGEGNTAGRAGRVMLVKDDVGPQPGVFSPGVTVKDLIDNAAEPVFGLGLDRLGKTLLVHGAQSYFAAIEDPFHLRLQGKYDSFDAGAGVAFHPNADGVASPEPERVGFVASANGTIEIVDAAYYVSRGKINIKGTMYGALRASLPFPTDAPNVVLKLFGLTPEGLVVIDLTAQDIRPVP